MKNITSTLKSVLIAVSFTFLLFSTKAQAQSFNEGDYLLNVGIGVGSSYQYYTGEGVKNSPVFTLSGERCITTLGPGKVGLGGAFGYQSASYTENYGNYYYKNRWSTLLFGGRATYHPDFLNSKKYDVYGALQISYNYIIHSYSSNDPYSSYYYDYATGYASSSLHPYLIAGARYFISKNIGVMAEVGYDLSYLKVGITIKK